MNSFYKKSLSLLVSFSIIFSQIGYIDFGLPVYAAAVNISCSGTSGAPTDVTVEASITTDDDVTFTNAGGDGWCELDDDIDAGSITIDAGVTLTHVAQDTDGVDLYATGAITINGDINTNSKGCASSTSPNLGAAGVCADAQSGEGTDGGIFGGGGGAYGGGGGTASGAGGSAYGSPTEPLYLGSGGGTGRSAAGIGGGLIKIESLGVTTIDGALSANADANTGNDNGAGSGGSIYIRTNGLVATVDGSLTANGGNTLANGGSGSGGRIALYLSDGGTRSAAATLIENTSASAGVANNANENGGDGTVIFVYDPTEDSTPIAADYPNISDDSIRIKSGFDFKKTASGTLAFAPNALEINAANNIRTDSNITNLTLNFGSSDDGLVTERMINSKVYCHDNTVALNITSATTDDLDSNTIQCTTAAATVNGGTYQNGPWTLADYDLSSLNLDFSGPATISGNVTTTSLSASSIDITDSIPGNTLTLSGATFTTRYGATVELDPSGSPNVFTSVDQGTFTIGNTGRVSIENSSSITGNINNATISEFDIDGTSTWTGNMIISNLGSTISDIDGTLTAQGLGCQNSEGPNGSGICTNKGTSADTGGDGGEGAVGGIGGGGGGGYGGAGGNGNGGASGGGTYGSSTNPNSFGSAGSNGRGRGGSGGGKIRLTSAGTLDVTGTITVNGNEALGSDDAGGSGGSLYMSAITFDGAGTVTANGGIGKVYGGGGGGGRIAFLYLNASGSFHSGATASGAAGANAGSDGTIVTTVLTAPSTPSIAAPTANLAQVDRQPTLTSSAFSSNGSPHTTTDWKVTTDLAGSNIVWSSLSDASNLASISLDGNGTYAGVLAGLDQLGLYTTYYAFVRHANGVGSSSWSSATPFTTAYSGTSTSQVWDFNEAGADTAGQVYSFNDTNIEVNVAGGLDKARLKDLGGNYAQALGPNGTTKKKTININNPNAELTNYQVRLTIAYDSDMQADFDDLRFADENGSALDYWIESKTDSVSAIVWVEIGTLAAATDTSIYMYYGNNALSSLSNGENTFIFFDDFDGPSLDGSKWTQGGGNLTFSGGTVKLDGITGCWPNNSNFSTYSLESKATLPTENFVVDIEVSSSGTNDYNHLFGYGASATSAEALIYRSGFNAEIQKTSPYSYGDRKSIANFANTARLTHTTGNNVTIDYSGATWARNNYDLSKIYILSSCSGQTTVDRVKVREYATNDPVISWGDESSVALAGWTKRQPYVIRNEGGLLSNYQVKLTIPYDSDMQADFDDLRFTSADGTTEIDYWLESKTNSNTATVWVEVPSLADGSVTPTTTLIYMYYGNALAISDSSLSNTFTANQIYGQAGNSSTTLSNVGSSNAVRSITPSYTNTATKIDWGSFWDGAAFNTNSRDNIYQRFRFIFAPSVAGDWHFALDSDDGSELILSPGDKNDPTGVSTFVNSFYGSHATSNGTGNNTERVGYSPVSFASGEAKWMDVVMAETGGGEGIRLYAKAPSGSYQIFNTTNFSGQIYARQYSDDVTVLASGIEASLADFSDITLSNISVKPTFTKLLTFNHSFSGTGSVSYQISHNGSDWYYHDGSSWTDVSADTDNNTASEINSYLPNYMTDFDPDLTTGNFYWKAFLISDGLQTAELNSVTLQYDAGVPVSLSNLAVDSTTATTANLSWTAPQEPAFSHYEIWYGTNLSDVQNRTGTALEWDNGDDANLATLGTTSTTITGLTTGVLYYFKIWAIDNFNQESTIAAISANTNQPPSVSSLTATQSASGSRLVNLSFTMDDPDDDDTLQSKVEYSTDSGATWANVSVNAVNSATNGTPLLDNNTTYQVGQAGGYITSSAGPNTVVVDWNALGQLNLTVPTSVQLRVTPYDGIIAGSPVITTLLLYTTTACGDNIDNDGDGYVDLSDLGCSSRTDTNEGDEPISERFSLGGGGGGAGGGTRPAPSFIDTISLNPGQIIEPEGSTDEISHSDLNNRLVSNIPIANLTDQQKVQLEIYKLTSGRLNVCFGLTADRCKTLYAEINKKLSSMSVALKNEVKEEIAKELIKEEEKSPELAKEKEVDQELVKTDEELRGAAPEKPSIPEVEQAEAVDVAKEVSRPSIEPKEKEVIILKPQGPVIVSRLSTSTEVVNLIPQAKDLLTSKGPTLHLQNKRLNNEGVLKYDRNRPLKFSDVGRFNPLYNLASVLKNTYLEVLGQRQYVLNGYSDELQLNGSTRVRLNESLSRLEWLQILMTSHGLPIYSLDQLPSIRHDGKVMPEFIDVPKNASNESDITPYIIYTAAYYGLIEGTKSGEAEPNRRINVQEAIKMLIKVGEFAQGTTYDSQPKQVAEGIPRDSWYFKYYAKAESQGLFNESVGSYDRINTPLIRGEGVEILFNALVKRSLYPDSAMVEIIKSLIP